MVEVIPAKHTLINGIGLSYEEYKRPYSAPTLLLLHGFLSSSFSFRKLIPLLVKDFNVITVDIPPFGKSGKSVHFTYSYENMAKTILELLDELSYKNIYAVGHSMGGQIVLNMLLQRPDDIIKAILLCSSGYLPRAKLPIIYSSYLPMFHHYVKYYLNKTGVLGNLKYVVHNKDLIDDTMIDGYTKPFNDPFIFRALTRMLRHREGDLSEKELQMINTPCLLIWGQHDRVVPLNIGKRLAKDLPNAKLIILEDAGHLIPEEVPEKIQEEIKKFIAWE